MYGVGLRAWHLLGVAVAIQIFTFASPAGATTYTYTGNPLSFSYQCGTSFCPTLSGHLSGLVQFNSDTSGASGTFVPSFAVLFLGELPNPGAVPIVSPLPSVTLSSGLVTAWGLISTIGGPNATQAVSATGGDTFSVAAPSIMYSAVGTSIVPGSWSSPLIDQQSSVPLPAALPLFATGLGALCLFGWSKKKKQRHSLPDANSIQFQRPPLRRSSC